MEKIEIELYNGRVVIMNKGETFKELLDKIHCQELVALCELSGDYYELCTEIPCSGKVNLVNAESEIGIKTYSRTLQYIFIKVSLDLFPKAKIKIEHSISKGTFGEIAKDKVLTKTEIDKIKEGMKDLIKRDVVINKVEVTKEKAIEIFSGYEMEDKVKLLNQVDFDNVSLYELEGRYDYFYGDMAYSTGIIKAFDLIQYGHGFILRNPVEGDVTTLADFKEQKRLANIFYETEEWLGILGVGEVGSLNEKVDSKDKKNLILISEALHEKKIAYMADKIVNKEDIKVVLIAGPSSSGKTTFANRLGIQLRVNGLMPIRMSLDDYFVDREFSPKDENGDYDFESIHSIDLKKFNQDLKGLLSGEEIEMPRYDFMTGKRGLKITKLSLPKNGIIIIEGIHGLNPILTNEIPDGNKYKIYISALTQLNIDNHNRIATTDVRKVRRIVRDYLSRGYGAEETLLMWPSIKNGEKKNIFIYQEEADDMFNSTLAYELCVLKTYAIKELEKIQPGSPVYNEAVRLKSFLYFFREIEFEEVLGNSILREFIGGSCFYKY